MTLPAGDRIGHYTITAAIGAGGMGEVYRARDTQLDRDVAIKILPALFSQDAEGPDIGARVELFAGSQQRFNTHGLLGHRGPFEQFEERQLNFEDFTHTRQNLCREE